MKAIAPLLVVVLTLLLPNAVLGTTLETLECKEGCGCWESCFKNPPQALKADYAILYRYVQQLRVGRFLDNTQSTALFVDQTFPSRGVQQLQKNIMKIAVMSLPAQKCCNPVAIIGLGGRTCWWWQRPFSISTQCLDRCDLLHVVDRAHNYRFRDTSRNNLGAASVFASAAMDRAFNCRFPQSRYGVAFTNSPQPSSANPGTFPVRASVSIDSSPPQGYASDFWLANQLKYSPSLETASRNLIHCMTDACCSCQRERGFGYDWIGDIFYAHVSNPKEILSAQGSLDVFLKEQGGEYSELQDDEEGSPKRL